MSNYWRGALGTLLSERTRGPGGRHVPVQVAKASRIGHSEASSPRHWVIMALSTLEAFQFIDLPATPLGVLLKLSVSLRCQSRRRPMPAES
jgi:hypothetical protein